LHQRLADRIGEREADVLMELLPPVAGDQVATKDDIASSEARLRLEMQLLGSNLSASFHRDIVRQTWIVVATIVAAFGAFAAAVGELAR
jgi:hypothetical protein